MLGLPWVPEVIFFARLGERSAAYKVDKSANVLGTGYLRLVPSAFWYTRRPGYLFMPLVYSSWGWGEGWKCPAEHNFEHNTLVSYVTPESIILYFTSIIRQTLKLGQKTWLSGVRTPKIIYNYRTVSRLLFTYRTSCYKSHFHTIELFKPQCQHATSHQCSPCTRSVISWENCLKIKTSLR